MRKVISMTLALAALAAPALADNMSGFAARHPVIKDDVARVKLDCVVRADGGLKDCRIVSANPAGRAEAFQVAHRFETEVHLQPGQAKPGAHKRLTYVWTKDAT